jgi:putative membrane protein
MIEYQITGWLKSTFSYRGTILPRVLLRVLLFPLITTLLIIGRDHSQELSALLQLVWLPPIGHSLIGTALGLVLVFRNNASYDRYWEGRKQWGGIVNASRNLARSARSYVGETKTLAPLVVGFCLALKHQLRGETSGEALREHLAEHQVARALKHPNPSLALNLAMSEWIEHARRSRGLSPELAQRLEVQVSALMDCQGACERILNTPVPFAHAVHVRQLLFFYLTSLPLVLIPLLDWAAVPTITLIALGLLGIEEAGVEIEDPFGHDPNDLPLSRICDVISRDVYALVDFDQGVTHEQSLSDVDESQEDESQEDEPQECDQ